MLKRTALFEEHLKLGGRMVDFGGWELPIQYSGIADEHMTCRTTLGIFDVSHMGEIEIQGKSAENYLNFLVTQNVARLQVHQAQYTVMCNERGGIVDDLVIYRRAPDFFLVVVNASNTEKDYKHMLSIQSKFQSLWPDLQITDSSSAFTQIAVQGQKAESILQQLTTTPLAQIKNYWFEEGKILENTPAIIARTGYTGEDGFEIYIPWNTGPSVWQALFEIGRPLGAKPCGLGARDTLRLEMKYPLYGNELSDETDPFEAGLGWVVKLDKTEFIGRSALLERQKNGHSNILTNSLDKKLVGIKLLGKGVLRHGYSIYSLDGTSMIGTLTSGTLSPYLKVPIGIGYVATDQSKIGTKLMIEIRGAKIPGEVVPTPFYKRMY